MKQNQHKVSQVYLKKFGYRNKNNQWKISALEISKFDLMKSNGKFHLSQKSIGSITAEFNIFDIRDEIPSNLNIIESLSSKLENYYPEILNELDKNQKLSNGNEQYLIQFIANLICRTDLFRRLLFNYVNSDSRVKLIKHLSVFQEDKGELLISKISNLNIEFQLNPVALLAMDYLSEKLITFDYIVLKDFKNKGWITSDNPVVLMDHHIPHKTILSIDSKIIFPLSRNYCMYLWHPNSKHKISIFDGFESKIVNDSTEDIQSYIFEQVRSNADIFIFFPNFQDFKLRF